MSNRHIVIMGAHARRIRTLQTCLSNLMHMYSRLRERCSLAEKENKRLVQVVRAHAQKYDTLAGLYLADNDQLPDTPELDSIITHNPKSAQST